MENKKEGIVEFKLLKQIFDGTLGKDLRDSFGRESQIEGILQKIRSDGEFMNGAEDVITLIKEINEFLNKTSEYGITDDEFDGFEKEIDSIVSNCQKNAKASIDTQDTQQR